MKAQKEGYKASTLPRCIQYSFIGFFYSGITPSATGGQPVQLYYMNKDGNRGSDSTVVLMTVAGGKVVYDNGVYNVGENVDTIYRECEKRKNRLLSQV